LGQKHNLRLVVVFLQQVILIRITALFRTIETKLNNVISMLVFGVLRGGQGRNLAEKGFLGSTGTDFALYIVNRLMGMDSVLVDSKRRRVFQKRML
jgi:hypothetical protein